VKLNAGFLEIKGCGSVSCSVVSSSL